MASAICVPATAHQSLRCCEMKSCRGSAVRRTSTFARVGAGLAVGVGIGGTAVPPLGVVAVGVESR